MIDKNFQRADEEKFCGQLGAVYSRKKTLFRVWQPFAESAVLRLYNAENEMFFKRKMRRERGIFEYEKMGDMDGVRYDFSITQNGKTVCSPDPYSRAITPDGRLSIVVNMRKNKPAGWDETSAISGENPIIYELSVRDFSMDKNANFASHGKFLAFCEENRTNSHGEKIGLEYIKSLGVTHIQLMPVFDFNFDGEQYNWGYNPRFPNVPSAYYSHNNAVLELRQLVLSAHEKGLGVVADVVYNHMFSAEKCAFGKIFPGYYFRGKSNGSGCGNEFASERFMARKFILDSLEFLAREYKFDGFRFDLMGLLDLKTMREIVRRLRRINPEILLYGEGWTGGVSALPERSRAVQRKARKLPEIAFFNDSFRDAVKGSVFDARGCGFVNGGAAEDCFSTIIQSISGNFLQDFWTDNSKQTINYVECHDNLTLFDKLNISLNNADLERIKRADKMAAALVFLSRGTPFIAAGQEFLRSKQGDENSYRSGDEVNALRWDQVTENREIVEYYRGLIAFRKRFLADFGEICYKRENGAYIISIYTQNGYFVILLNSTGEKFFPNIDGEFEIFIDKNCASDKSLFTQKRLCCAEYSVLAARRLN